MFGQNDVIAVFIVCCCFDLKPVSLAHAWAGGGGRVGVGAGRKKTEHDFNHYWQSWSQESLLRKEADKIMIMIIILVNHYGCK